MIQKQIQEKRSARPYKTVVEAVQAFLNEKGVVPKKMSKQEIIDAMLALGINEAALMIEEGICDRVQDMDLAMIYGTGFPPYRGGILEKQYGIRFQPAKLIKKIAESGKTFYTE